MNDNKKKPQIGILLSRCCKNVPTYNWRSTRQASYKMILFQLPSHGNVIVSFDIHFVLLILCIRGARVTGGDVSVG